MTWRAVFLWPGVRVVLVNRVARVRARRWRWHEVVVQVEQGGIETWWMGNLRIVL